MKKLKKSSKKKDKLLANIPSDLMIVGYRRDKDTGKLVPIYGEKDPEGFYSGRNRKPR
tara:strand:- start:42 stop:215 length:174 start_codon:yes stop_codon:yes gene_type:complete